MPFEIIDLDEGRGTTMLGSGIFTGEEYIDALERHLLQDKEKFKKYRYSLFDITAVTEMTAFPSGTIHLAVDMCKQAAQINPDVVVAIVADKDLPFGLSRMYEILMNETGWEIMIFKARDAAETWIKEKAKEKFGIENLTMESA